MEGVFTRSLHLQLIAKICGTNDIVKGTTSEIFSQVLATYLQEIAIAAKNSASVGGRTIVNAADVLATFGDACELLEYFEKTTKRQQTIIDKPSSTFTRKKPRLRPTLAVAGIEYPRYLPAFLPVLPRKEEFCTEKELPQFRCKSETDAQNQSSPLYNSLKRQEIETFDPFVKRTILSTDEAHPPTQSLRVSQKEQGITIKASTLVYGSVPVLDNS